MFKFRSNLGGFRCIPLPLRNMNRFSVYVYYCGFQYTYTTVVLIMFWVNRSNELCEPLRRRSCALDQSALFKVLHHNKYRWFESWEGGSQCSRNYCHRDSQTKLGGGHDYDDDPFAREVEAGLEEESSNRRRISYPNS